MRTISIDIETYSPEPLASAGVYKYAEHPDFDILLLAYSIDDQPVQVIDLAQGEAIPTHILAALTDCTITKYAYNANFERVCLTHYLRKRNHLHPGAYLDPHGWHCTMVWSAYPGHAQHLQLERDAQPRLRPTRMGESGSFLIAGATSMWSSRSMTGLPTSGSQCPSGTPTHSTRTSTTPTFG